MSHTFVLVHGVWTGGWVWNAVAGELESRGHRVVAPTMPGTAPGEDPGAVSLSDATDHLVSRIEQLDLTDIVLVAHDWAGYPVTAATHGVLGRISRIVYWSAFAPVADESILDAIPADDRAALTAAGEASGGRSILIPFPRWQNKFVQTSPAEVQELTYRLLWPAPIRYFTGSLSAEEAKVPDVPITYLVGSQDFSIDFGEDSWATKYPPRLGVEPVMFEGCHTEYFTNPGPVADQLVLAAQGATSDHH